MGASVSSPKLGSSAFAKIGAELHVRAGAVAVVSTATQLGYAVGLLLLVPLGDAVERRKLLVANLAKLSIRARPARCVSAGWC